MHARYDLLARGEIIIATTPDRCDFRERRCLSFPAPFLLTTHKLTTQAIIIIALSLAVSHPFLSRGRVPRGRRAAPQFAERNPRRWRKMDP